MGNCASSPQAVVVADAADAATRAPASGASCKAAAPTWAASTTSFSTSLQSQRAVVEVKSTLKSLLALECDGSRASCDAAASALLQVFSSSGADLVSLASCSAVEDGAGMIMLAGAAGAGADVLAAQPLMPFNLGSRWSAAICSSLPAATPYLYRSVASADDAAVLPDDWQALHAQAGLRTFLALAVAAPQPGRAPLGALTLASRQAGAFTAGCLDLSLAIAATALAPVLGARQPLGALAAAVMDAGSFEVAEAAGAFLAGAASLLRSAARMDLGVRLGLLSEDGDEVLVLYTRSAAHGGRHSVACSLHMPGAIEEEGPLDGTFDSPGFSGDSLGELLCSSGAKSSRAPASQGSTANSATAAAGPAATLRAVKLPAANTLLRQAVDSRAEVFCADTAPLLDSLGSCASTDTLDEGLDVLEAGDAGEDPPRAALVLPLFGAAGEPRGALYVVHAAPGGALARAPAVRELGALAQALVAGGLLKLEQHGWLEALLPVLQGCEDAAASSGELSAGCELCPGPVSAPLLRRAASELSSCTLVSCSGLGAGGLQRTNGRMGSGSGAFRRAFLQEMWRVQDTQVLASRGYVDMSLTSLLGKGGFGEVYAGSWHSSRAAVKVLRIPPNARPDLSVKAAMEMAVLSTVSHPNIVRVFATMADMIEESSHMSDSAESTCDLGLRFRKAEPEDHAVDATLCHLVVMEHCDRGNLWTCLSAALLHTRLPDGRLKINMRLLLQVLLDVARALQHLHSLGIVHCDLKAENVLVCTAPARPGGLTCKLTDFGLVKLLGERSRARRNRDTSGTLTHLAPERFSAGGLVTTAVDAWSFGCLMYELYSTKRPFAGEVGGASLVRRVQLGLRPQLPSSTPTPFVALAEACWAARIDQRPSMDAIVTALQDMLV